MDSAVERGRGRTGARGAVGFLLLGAAWLSGTSPLGDLFGHWTDQLRHQGEALALWGHGPGAYAQTYDEATRGVTLPCPEHAGLWGAVGIPYPPLALAWHLPLALLERSGVVAPALSHRLQTFLSLGAGLFAAGLAVRLSRRSRALSGYAALWLGPLVVGAGACGFYDSVVVLCALVAMEAAERESPSVWLWSGLAAALHVRGFLSPFLSPAPRSTRGLATFAALALPTVVVALVVLLATPPFPLDHRFHLLKHGWLLVLLTTPVAVVAWRSGARAVLPPLVAATALMLVDRQTAWWHLLVPALVPLAAASKRAPEATRTAVVAATCAWVVVVSFLAMRSLVPAPVMWLVIRG
jgi:hypothetical protein